MSDPSAGAPQCGCCKGIETATPARVENPPGQAAITYRAGHHNQFLASMQARLSSTDYPALAALGSREASDFTIALTDALASSLDVLSFYTERFANEHYLRTASERLSVIELARLIGYQAAPGVAASTHLAFTLQASPGAPAAPITIPVGTRVQSVPGQDEQAQTFETVAAAPARAEWNALAVQQDVVRTPVAGDTGLWLRGATTGLSAGDMLLITTLPPEAVPANSAHWSARVLSRVTVDADRQLTEATWTQPLGADQPFLPPDGERARIYVLRKRAAVFGATAADWRALSDDAKATYIGLPGATHLARPADTEEWPDFSVLAPVYPERRSGAMGTLDTPVAATIDDIVLAATGAAQAAATKAMSNAANAAGGVVAAGGALANNAVAFAQETFAGMSGVAKLAVDDVVARTRTLIQGQAQALQALQGSAGVLVWNGAVESVRTAITASLSGLPVLVQDLAANGVTDPREVAKAVLDQIVDGLPDEVPDAIGVSLKSAWIAGLGKAKAEIGTTQSQLGEPSDPLSAVVAALAPVLAARKALEAAVSRLGNLDPPSFGDEPAQLVQGVVDALASAINDVNVGSALGELLNPAGGVDALQSAIAQLLGAGSGVGASLVDLQSAIAGAAGAVFAKLGEETRSIAAQAQASVAGAAELLNPANAVNALGESAAELHHHGRTAAAAALGASAAADVAGLVTLAVNLAKKQDSLPLFDPPTPQSIAAVARHFAALGVTRAGGSVPAADTQGQAAALIEAIQGLLPASAQSPLSAAEQLLPLIGDADELLNAPANAAMEAYLAITSEVDRALKGRIVTKPGRRAPLVRSPDSIDISPAHDAITAGGWALLSVPGQRELYRIAQAGTGNRAEYLLSGQTSRLQLAGPLPDGRLPAAFEHAVRGLSVHLQSEELALAGTPLSTPVYGDALALDGHVQGLQPGQAVALVGPNPRIRITHAGRGTPLRAADGSSLRTLAEADSLRLIAAPERLIDGVAEYLTPAQFGAALGNATLRLRLHLADRDGLTGHIEAAGNAIMLADALEDDDTQAEIALIAAGDVAIQHDRDRSHVRLADPTRHVYDRRMLRINANVAPATHGESVEAIAGNGDGSLAGQQFALTQAPLTFVSASTPSGRRSTLEVRVNDVLWAELPTLFGSSAEARVFETSRNDAAVTTLRFGDGIEGARLPSGLSNIRVRYRKGLGVAGNVAAGTLTTLLSRPLGVSEAVNPVAASGGEDAESLDRARQNAPMTVLTLDRVVSIADYANFARAFAGIDKAHALWIPAGPAYGVVLTIAGEDGAAVPESSAPYRHLRDALRSQGDPLVPLRLLNYRDVRFRCGLAVKVLATHATEPVLAAVDAALRKHFCFGARHFGQPVSVDEVAATAQAVSGVEAVHVTRLQRSDAAPPFSPRLFAMLPVASLNTLPEAAELLTLADDAVDLELLP